MKKFPLSAFRFPLFILCVSASLRLNAYTPVRFDVVSLTGTVNNRQILVTPDVVQNPLVLGTNLIATTPFLLQPVSGTITTNLAPWGYTIKVDGWPRSAHIIVPDTTNTVTAVSLINTNLFSPLTIYTGDVTISGSGTLNTNVDFVISNGAAMRIDGTVTAPGGFIGDATLVSNVQVSAIRGTVADSDNPGMRLVTVNSAEAQTFTALSTNDPTVIDIGLATIKGNFIGPITGIASAATLAANSTLWGGVAATPTGLASLIGGNVFTNALTGTANFAITTNGAGAITLGANLGTAANSNAAAFTTPSQVNQQINTNQVRHVVDVTKYGAVADGSTDCTLAISNAIRVQITTRLPLYFPATTSGNYYKISGPLGSYNGLTDLRSVNVPSSDTASRIEIFGDTGATIVQTVDAPVFVFTNGLNWINIEGLKIANSAATKTTPGIAFYTVGIVGGQNTDNVLVKNVEIEGFYHGVYSEGGAIMSFEQVDWTGNRWSVWLTDQNAAGTVATKNNSVTFNSCVFIGNWNGGYIRGGFGILIDNCEMGGPTQTNLFTFNAVAACKATFRLGNAELYNGSAAKIISANGDASPVTIVFDNFGLNDFSPSAGGDPGGIWSVHSTNRVAGPRVAFQNIGGSVRMFDCAAGRNSSSKYGSVQVVGTNQFVNSNNLFTNYVGIEAADIFASDGVDYNGAAPSQAYESGFRVRANADAKGRSWLSWGMNSNFGPNQATFNVPLNKYNIDLADGLIVNGSVSNYFSAANRFESTAWFVGLTRLINNSTTTGPFFYPAIGRMGFMVIQNNFATDDAGFYFNRNNVAALPTATTGVPLLYWDQGSGANRTHIGWTTANTQPSGTSTLNVYGTGYFSGGVAVGTNATIRAGVSGQTVMSTVVGTNYWVNDAGGGIWTTNHIP